MTTTSPKQHDYLPGFGHDMLLPLYDTVQRLLGVPRLHQALLAYAEVRAGDHVLEVGCGTGNLTLMAARSLPQAHVVGIDPDRRALSRAERKSDGTAVRFEHGYGQELPFADASFDHALSAFMFHHLDADTKTKTLHEIRRVLRPGGALLLMDFGGRVSAADGVMGRIFRRTARMKDNLGDAIPVRMRDAGFTVVTELSKLSTRVGPVTVYRAGD